MIVIKWEKDENVYTFDEYYDLFAYTENNKKIHIAILYWSNNRWIMSDYIPYLKSETKWYENYTINEVNDVLFRAVLDIQSDLSRINNMCVDYCNAISDYVIDYVQGIDHNED